MNSGSFSGGPPAPGNYITSSLENTTRPLFDSLNQVLQAINHVACFIDSTVFAIWTSVTAAGSIVAAAKSVRTIYIRKWAESIKKFLSKIKMILKTSSGRKKLILILSIAVSLPVLLKALQTILKNEEGSDSSLVSQNQLKSMNLQEYDSNTITEDELSSKVMFVRALYTYEPADKSVYLSLNPGTVVLISKDDELKLEGPAPNWITGKLKNGSIGYFPSNYVSIIK